MHHTSASSSQAGGEAAPATAGRLIHWARWYDLCVAVASLGHGPALRRQTVALAGIRPGDRVLDVGCGTGDLTLAAAAQAGPSGEVVGSDASPEMIQVARRKAAGRGLPVRFELAPVEALPFPDGYFDVALSSLMLHHLPGQLKQDGLAQVYRVLKPGGRLLVVDFAGGPSGHGHFLMAALGHRARHEDPGSLGPLLVEAGYVLAEEGTLVMGALAYAKGIKGEAVNG